jgi:hypothetical protein
VLHDQALTIELQARSLAELLGREAIERWAQREMFTQEVQPLLAPPAVPEWLQARLT